ncbi:MAG: AbrB/MazE/SpoVT family DNA-binding domain-containing protein [Acidimicrobiia bacterium]|nr:AbrB/MazE/SpoVT family DNA-binding domain-containing protein [Acidimicrobiia bacterium]
MKSIGMARKVDQLGRVVLPAELRRLFDIHEGDFLEIEVDEGRIVLTKVEEHCVFCGTALDLVTYRDRKICQGCIVRLAES